MSQARSVRNLEQKKTKLARAPLSLSYRSPCVENLFSFQEELRNFRCALREGGNDSIFPPALFREEQGTMTNQGCQETCQCQAVCVKVVCQGKSPCLDI